MDSELLKFRYTLAKSETYQHIRSQQLDEIVNRATSSITSDELRGMLKLIKLTDEWVSDYEDYRKRTEDKD